MSLTRRPRHRTHARRTFFSLFSTARHALRRSRLWKALGGAVAALLAIGMVATGVSLSASAAGSGDPTPYVVTAQGVTLPAGVIFPSSGHVNYKATRLDHTGERSFGVHFDPNNKQPGGRFIGQAFFPFSNIGADDNYGAVTSSAANAFPDGYCITWVQVSMYNEHFGEGGQNPICTVNTVKSTALYLYKKLDASKPAAWENSGKQTRIATWDGWSFATVYPGSLPGDVCGDGWGVQQDQVKGAQSIFPLHIEYPVDNIGWPPIVAAQHSELSALVTVPPCATGKIATATVSTTPATCHSAEKLVYGGISNADFSGTEDGTTGPAEFSVLATASSGSEFAGGDVSLNEQRTVKTFEGTLAGQLSPTDPDCVTAVSIDTDPSASSCTNTGDTDLTSWIFVALNEGVIYKIGGTVLTSQYTAAAPGVEVHVTAEAAPGFTLVGTHTHDWYLTPESTDCQLEDLPVVTPVVTQTAATCSAGGSYTLGVAESTLADHVVWTVDDKTVAPGTYSAPAGTKVHVVVTAVEGFGINTGTEEEPAQEPSMEWTLTIASPSAACGDLKTLAFTGADGSMGGMLIIALFLLLGGAGVYTASRLRGRES